MTPPLYVLDALQFGHVTNVRASEDDVPADVFQYKIAYSNLLLSALGVRGFHDSLWTTSVQEPNHYDDFVFFDAEMNAIVSLLGRGPFGFGDDIGKTNLSIIRRVCRADGRLLHPSKSITPIEVSFFTESNQSRAFGVEPFHRPYAGEIWSTFTAQTLADGEITSFVVLAVDVWKAPYELSFVDCIQNRRPMQALWCISLTILCRLRSAGALATTTRS